jgi:hypothetical protein
MEILSVCDHVNESISKHTHTHTSLRKSSLTPCLWCLLWLLRYNKVVKLGRSRLCIGDDEFSQGPAALEAPFLLRCPGPYPELLWHPSHLGKTLELSPVFEIKRLLGLGVCPLLPNKPPKVHSLETGALTL